MMLPLLLTLKCVLTEAPFVLAVGVNAPAQADLKPLRYADDDAAAAAELFGGALDRTFLLGTMDEDSQERFPRLRSLARPGTLTQLRWAVKEMSTGLIRARDAGEQPVVLVWLIGHGAFAKDGQPFVALEDGALTPELLDKDILAPLSMAHRIHVIMDACHAGAMMQWRAAVEQVNPAEVNRQSFLKPLSPHANVGLISAAAAHQKTYEWEEMHAGIFSALVRAGMRGAANADGDACVTYDEVAAYVSAALQGIPVPEARPRVMSQTPAVDGGAPLACAGWFAGHATLKGDLAHLGSFHVEDSRGVWITGGRFEPGHQGQLWLPAASSSASNPLLAQLTVRTQQGEWPLEASADNVLHMPEQPVVVSTQPRGAVERAIKEGLFQVPYGPSYLRGFQAAKPLRALAAPPRGPRPPTPTRLPWLSLLSLPPAGLALICGTATAGLLTVGGWQLVQSFTASTGNAKDVRTASAVALSAGAVTSLVAVLSIIAAVAAGASGVFWR